MSGAQRARVGGVDERRRQATLLHPFVNGVRELGCARLSSSVRRGVAVGEQQPSVRHQQALGDGGSSSLPAPGSGGAALPAMAVKQREREGRKREMRESQPRFDST